MDDISNNGNHGDNRGYKNNFRSGGFRPQNGSNRPHKPFNRTRDRQKGMVSAFIQGKGQNAALKWLMESRTPVCVFLITGVKFEGLISAFDSFTIKISDVKHNQQMIYKDKISTITVKKPENGFHGTRRPMGMMGGQGSFQGQRGVSRPLAGDPEDTGDDGVTLPTHHVEYQG